MNHTLITMTIKNNKKNNDKKGQGMMTSTVNPLTQTVFVIEGYRRGIMKELVAELGFKKPFLVTDQEK